MVQHCIDYVDQARPLSFVLENVARLMTQDGGAFYQWLLAQLSCNGAYQVSSRVLNTRRHGLPQSRSRLYIVGLLAHAMVAPFEFPDEIEPLSLTDILDPVSPADCCSTLPPQSQRNARANAARALLFPATKVLLASGSDALMDVDASQGWCGKASPVAPCLTGAATRHLAALSREASWPGRDVTPAGSSLWLRYVARQ